MSSASWDALVVVVASEKRLAATWADERRGPRSPPPAPNNPLRAPLVHVADSHGAPADAQGVQDPLWQGHGRRQAQEGPQRARPSPFSLVSLAKQWPSSAVADSASRPHLQKRPLSAYMHFSQDKRAEVKEENPDVTFGASSRSLLLVPPDRNAFKQSSP